MWVFDVCATYKRKKEAILMSYTHSFEELTYVYISIRWHIL